MQENTESEKPEDSEIPEDEIVASNEEEATENTSSDSTQDDPQFEEQDGEVLPPEKKKGCGFFIFILLLLTGGSGYLYYTDQVPKQIREWVEPLVKPLEQQYAKLVPAPPSSEKRVSQPKEKIIAPEIKIPVLENKPPKETVPSPSIEEHVSGSETEPVMEVIVSDYPAKISGSDTLVEPEVVQEAKSAIEEPEKFEEEPVEEMEPAPVVTTSHQQPSPVVKEPFHRPEPAQKVEVERNEAVQAYLDFFEATLAKVGELVKAGFNKGKDFLMKSLG